MKSSSEIAKIIGVTNQAVLKRLTPAFKAKYGITKSGKSYAINEEAEKALLVLFKVGNRLATESKNSEPVANQVANLIGNQFTIEENENLKKRVEILETELKTEREYNRELTTQVVELATKFSSLATESHVLLAVEQHKNTDNRFVAWFKSLFKRGKIE